MRGLPLAAIALLGACQLLGTHSASVGGGSAPSGGGGGPAPTSSDPNAMITMPSIVGMTKDQANAALAKAGFTNTVEERPMTCDNEKPEPGMIECQDPEPGAKVAARTWPSVRMRAPIDHSFFRPEDFDSLKGLTVEQAKTKAKQIGHTGDVKVEEASRFMKDCKPNTVCTATDERGGQSGMSLHDSLLLTTNKTLSIAPPPD